VSVQGSCLCGAVRWTAEAPFRSMSHCHCSMCRKHHGAAFVTWLASPLEGFRWDAGEDQIHEWRSSERYSRRFCGICGSSLPWIEGDTFVGLAGSLEGELGIRPQRHIFAASKAAWYEITDGLPQVAAYPEAWGIPPEERPAVEAEPGLVLGSCLCGGVAFEIDADALLMARNCHCSRCRRQTGAAHASNLFARMDGLRFRRGEELLRSFKVPEAERFATCFCGTCGSLAPRPITQFGRWLIPMGLLDTDPGMSPDSHIFVADKASWFDITDGMPQYAGYPPA
jgi:hypothetical protein